MKEKKMYIGVAKVMIMVAVVLCTFWFINSNEVKAADVGAPQNVKQIAADNNTIYLQWDSVLNADRYLIEISTDNMNWKQVESSVSTTEYITNLSAGTSYYLRIKVEDTGATSDVIEVVTAPGEVTGAKQIDQTTNSITLQWNKTTGATGYIVLAYVNSSVVQVGETTNNKITIKEKVSKTSTNTYYIYPYKTSKHGFTAITSLSYDSVYGAKTISEKILNLKTYDWNIKTNEFTCIFDYNDTAEGYQVQIYNKNKTAIKTADSTSRYISFKKMSLNSFYYGRVRGYVTINGIKKYGAWSSYTYFVPQAKMKGKLKISGGNLKVSWNKVAGATGYDVYVSTTSSSKGYKKVASVNAKTTSCNVKKVGKTKVSKSRGKTYYVYVVTKKKVGKKTLKAIPFYYNSLYYY